MRRPASVPSVPSRLNPGAGSPALGTAQTSRDRRGPTHGRRDEEGFGERHGHNLREGPRGPATPSGPTGRPKARSAVRHGTCAPVPGPRPGAHSEVQDEVPTRLTSGGSVMTGVDYSTGTPAFEQRIGDAGGHLRARGELGRAARARQRAQAAPHVARSDRGPLGHRCLDPWADGDVDRARRRGRHPVPRPGHGGLRPSPRAHRDTPGCCGTASSGSDLKSELKAHDVRSPWPPSTRARTRWDIERLSGTAAQTSTAAMISSGMSKLA